MGIDPHPRPPCLVASLSSSRSVSFYFINTWFFSTIANIANRAIYEYPYSSQVIGNHLILPLKAGLSTYSILVYIGFKVCFLDKDGISMQQVFSSNTYHLMQQYI
jgi:hypothetical protein